LTNVVIGIPSIRELYLKAPVIGIFQVNGFESLVRRECKLAHRQDMQIALPNPRDLLEGMVVKKQIEMQFSLHNGVQMTCIKQIAGQYS